MVVLHLIISSMMVTLYLIQLLTSSIVIKEHIWYILNVYAVHTNKFTMLKVYKIYLCRHHFTTTVPQMDQEKKKI